MSRSFKLNIPRLLFVFTLLMLLSTGAKADIIYDLDYDTTFREGFFTTGDAVATVGFNNNAGVGGSNGAVVTFDSTGTPGTPFSAGLFNNILNSNQLKTPTATSRSDYVFSFDARATGFIAGQNSVSAQTTFGIDGMNFVNNAGGFSITDQFQTFTFSLGTGAINPDVFLAQNGRPTFRVDALGIQSRFGQDTGNTLVFDNFRITEIQAVPEPGAFFVLSFGMTALVCRRRRRRQFSKA